MEKTEESYIHREESHMQKVQKEEEVAGRAVFPQTHASKGEVIDPADGGLCSRMHESKIGEQKAVEDKRSCSGGGSGGDGARTD